MAYKELQLATISKMTAVFEKNPLRFSLFTYKSDADNLATVFTDDYFALALYGGSDTTKINGVLSEHDTIMVQSADGTDMAFGIITDNAGVAVLKRFNLVSQ